MTRKYEGYGRVVGSVTPIDPRNASDLQQDMENMRQELVFVKDELKDTKTDRDTAEAEVQELKISLGVLRRRVRFVMDELEKALNA